MSCMFVICLVTAHQPAPFGSAEVCGCAEARAADGQCAKCGVGYFALVPVRSQTLYTTLDSHGHEVAAALTRCAECRELIADGGYCDACHMGYVNGKGYFAKLGYHVARGRMIDPAAVRPSCCAPEDGWCATCKRGIVGNREFDDSADFESARRYVTILKAAVSKAVECEDCAMAMVADSRCRLCKIEYKDGMPVERSTSPSRGDQPSR